MAGHDPDGAVPRGLTAHPRPYDLPSRRQEFRPPPLCRRSNSDNFEELPGKWQAAILEAERNRPKLRLVSDP